MEFTDAGILLAARAHGENHAVANIFTAQHGRWAGLVYGGQGARKKSLLQPGNVFSLQWKGKTDASLGHFDLELEQARAAQYMHDRLSLAALSALCAVAASCLPERENQEGVYGGMAVVLDHLYDHDLWPSLFARWEAGLLAASGFGLTLDRCAATGTQRDLIYVSPKSAQAVCAQAGEPYKDKLLALPRFLRTGEAAQLPDNGAPDEHDDAINGLRLTGYFLEHRILAAANQGMPEARRRLFELLSN
ncbi:MAG: DNA repair protein RecO [Pseudomonadota bacterium]